MSTVVLRILREDLKKRKLCSPCTRTPRHIPQFLTQKQVATLNHPPYSPDLSHPDYFLFPKVKLQLKGARFDTIEEIQKAVTDQLHKIPAVDFSNAIKKVGNTC
jgi:histone-lysine N-methyltransferase SETMAR